MIANKQEDVGIFEVTKGNRQRLRFIEAPFDGFGDLGFPLRITSSEWETMTEVYYPFGKLFCHPLFTMWLDTIEVGDKWGGHVERVFEIVLRFGLLRRTFGPYLTRGLAEKKALAFLIEHHAIELIDEKGDT